MHSLVLLANARLPSERAQSLQVLQAACSFARAGTTCALLHARRRQVATLPAGQDLFSHYGVPPGARAQVTAVACVDWIDSLPRKLQYLPARLQELSFSRNAARLVRSQHPRSIVLSREIEAARALVRAGHGAVFLELHRLPGGRTRMGWLQEVLPALRGLVAISGGVREDLLGLGATPDQVFVAHDAFETTRFEHAPTRAAARGALELDREQPLVVYTGGLLAWKGVDVLVEAARLLPEVQVLVAGGMAADVQELRAKAAGLDNVRIDGFQPPGRVPTYLAAADVLAVPNRSQPAISSRYTSPLKVFEAMAMGLPVVASDLPSMRDLLSHGEDAWLVAPDRPEALADGLRTVLADSGLRERLGRNLGAQMDMHSWDARAKRLLEWMGARANSGR